MTLAELKEESERLYDAFTIWLLDQTKGDLSAGQWSIIEYFLTGDIGNYTKQDTLGGTGKDERSCALSLLTYFYFYKVRPAERPASNLALSRFADRLSTHGYADVELVLGPEMTATEVLRRLKEPLNLKPGSPYLLDEHKEPKPPIGVMPEVLHEEIRMQELSRAINDYMNFNAIKNINVLRQWTKELDERLRLFEYKFCKDEAVKIAQEYMDAESPWTKFIRGDKKWMS